MAPPEQEPPERRPRLKARDLVARMPEQEHLRLANAIGAGLHDARVAAECLTDPRPRAEEVLELQFYLSRAIRHLELARQLLQRALEETV
ncbi:MAG: hypothetical protein IT307_14050 [Chloroflexi bacterium]|nr:hypothetical protein [Chloroflexota bacterium]